MKRFVVAESIINLQLLNKKFGEKKKEAKRDLALLRLVQQQAQRNKLSVWVCVCVYEVVYEQNTTSNENLMKQYRRRCSAIAPSKVRFNATNVLSI